MKTAIHIALQSLRANDAIGTDVLQMRACLLEAGYSTDIFASGFDACFDDIARPVNTTEPARWSSSDILLYHHGTGWPQGEALLDAASHCRLVIRYHNVTPPDYFLGISDAHVDACREGQELTKRLANLPHATFWAASEFNAEELISYGAPPECCSVLPPFHNIEALAAEPFDYSIPAEFKARGPLILFVGGFKPNKGHERAIHLFARYYFERNSAARLVFAGTMSPAFEPYTTALRSLIRELQLEHAVLFAASASPSRLRTLYLLADLFLCVSDHEGFCVPLVEAMYFRVPILAWGTTAVAQTVGRCGLVWEEFDEDVFLESIQRILDNPQLASHCRDLGRKRYRSEFDTAVLKRRLLGLAEDVIASPQTPVARHALAPG